MTSSWKALNAIVAFWLLSLAPRTGTGQSTAPARVDTANFRSDSDMGVGRLPLEPRRTARFRVTEGTWMSLDVSPDGKTIVFDLLGDLYTLPIVGGKGSRLTSGTAFHRQPRYSPDGKHLTFVSDRTGYPNVWIADADGRNARKISNLLSEVGVDEPVISPAWSPDGKTIVVSQQLRATRRGERGGDAWLLATYDVGTRQMRWLSDTTADRLRSALGPVFAPDGRFVYAAFGPVNEPLDIAIREQIARINIATGHVEPEMGVYATRAGLRPLLSPNGRYLVYASNSGTHLGFRIRDLDTERERWLIREVLDDPPYLGPSGVSRDLVPGYAFTPDSKTLVAAFGGHFHRIDVATGHASLIPFVVDVARPLGALGLHQFSLPDTAIGTRGVMQPAVSPDGHWLAFSALARIWVAELPHGGAHMGTPHRLTADSIGEFYPSWSPDGKWIAYSTWQDGVGGAVWRTPVRETPTATARSAERLTMDSAVYFNTAVAPDGRLVVAARGPVAPERMLTHSGAYAGVGPSWLTLVAIPAEGGAPQVITALNKLTPLNMRDPTEPLYFAADTDRVYVGLTSWRLDGTDQRADITLRPGSSEPSVADVTGVIGPNGHRAMVTQRRSLFELVRQRARVVYADTLDLAGIQSATFGASSSAARRWGPVLGPWFSWSRNGRRVVFSQGAAIYVGDVPENGWTTFRRLEVPLRVPVDIPHGTIALRNARLITMRNYQVIERGDLVVHDNRILALGPAGRVSIPPGAHIMDLAGATILPGYVDVHDHFQVPGGVHPGQSWHCLVRLAYGLTTLRDPWPMPRYNDVFAYQERERTGELLCPRVFSTGWATSYAGFDPPIRTLDDARTAIRPWVQDFRTETFKFMGIRQGRGSWQLVFQALEEARLNGTVHVESDIAPLTMMMDGSSGVEHPFYIRIYDDVANLVAQSGTTHTQTFLSVFTGAYTKRHYGDLWGWGGMRRFTPPSVRPVFCPVCVNLERGSLAGAAIDIDNLVPLLGNAKREVAKGGHVGLGSHGDMSGIGIHYEMWAYALGGMPNHDVLRTATIEGARAIGHARDLGSLEVGKLADLQILDKNPLEDIHNTTRIRYVMKNGRLYEAGDLTQIWPEFKPLPRIYIWANTRADSTQAATAAHH